MHRLIVGCAAVAVLMVSPKMETPAPRPGPAVFGVRLPMGLADMMLAGSRSWAPPVSGGWFQVSAAIPPLVENAIPREKAGRGRDAEIGLASWYGAERQGRPTASGDLFDQAKFTAAHPRIALGTMVRVTNLRNHKSALLRVNDRGPSVSGRVLDVSRAAAERLGFLEAGLARVRIDVVNSP